MSMINNNTKSKIPTIEQLEQRFLSVASESGFRVMRNADISIDLDNTISGDVARADVAVFARLLIQAYGGWPFYPQILRRRILTALLRIYNSVSEPIKVRDLYEQLKSIIKIMPDKHIMVAGDKSPAVNMSTAMDVGDNLVKSKNINKPYLIEKQGRVGIIAFSRFFEPDDKAHLERIKKQVLSVMSGTDAIIIDLRNNGGGDPTIASMLGETLSGYDALPHSRRMFARNTKLAIEIHKYLNMPVLKKVSGNTDPYLLVDNSKFKMPKNYKWAYNGDIYVLANNRSASSSERVITFMKYNPRTKVIGTHSSGCLQYTNYRFVVLSGSGISVRLPLVYKEVPHTKPRGFETHGFEPDVLCEPGTDAFKVAMNMINGRDMKNVLYIKKNTVEK